MYDTVLVATDGSRGALTAARHAIDIAETTGASLHVLSVVPPAAWASVGRSVTSDLDQRAEQAVEKISGLAADAGLEAVTAVREGTPHEEIVACADEQDVDLVVLGTHGRTGLERHLVGSVAERVVRTSPRPVLTVGPGERTAVTSAEQANERARAALERRGHEEVTFPESPSPQKNAWVARADTDRGTFNVYVDRSTGEAHVVPV